MAKWLCRDEGAELEIEAETAGKAAREYVDGGDWGEIESTSWIHVWVAPADNPDCGEQIQVTLDPVAPDCTDDAADHDWRSPLSLVGGIESNPGVWGHGGGVVIREVCAHCGAYCETDTWAQDPATGIQGLRSVSYRDADEASLEWVAQRAAR